MVAEPAAEEEEEEEEEMTVDMFENSSIKVKARSLCTRGEVRVGLGTNSLLMQSL